MSIALSLWNGRVVAALTPEPIVYQRAECGDSAFGVWPGDFEIDSGATLGGQHHQIQDTVPVGRAAIAEYLDFGLELFGQLNKSGGGPEMEAQVIGNLDLAAVRLRHDSASLLPAIAGRSPEHSEYSPSASPSLSLSNV
jgi:hypothetical protein